MNVLLKTKNLCLDWLPKMQTTHKQQILSSKFQLVCKCLFDGLYSLYRKNSEELHAEDCTWTGGFYYILDSTTAVKLCDDQNEIF